MLGVEVDIWFGKGRRDAFNIRTDIVVGSCSRSSSAEVETSSSRVRHLVYAKRVRFYLILRRVAYALPNLDERISTVCPV